MLDTIFVGNALESGARFYGHDDNFYPLNVSSRRQYLSSGSVSAKCYVGQGETVLNKTVFLSDLADANLALLSPIAITLYVEHGQAIAYSYDLDELAVGGDESSALDEMRAMISESYRLLKDEQENLGRLQQKHWNYLKRIIREI